MEINEISKKEVSKVIDNTITEIEKCRDELNRKCDEAAKDIAEFVDNHESINEKTEKYLKKIEAKFENKALKEAMAENPVKPDLSSFDTSNMTDMEWIFHGCYELQELDLSNFNTSNVTNMKRMFLGCGKLQELNLSSFDTSNVTDMAGMFNGCNRLQSLDLSNFDTSNVATMSEMFNECSSLRSLNLSSFDTSDVVDMSNMFNGCKELEKIVGVLDLAVLDREDAENMFRGCTKLKECHLVNVSDSVTAETLGLSQEQFDKFTRGKIL